MPIQHKRYLLVITFGASALFALFSLFFPHPDTTTALNHTARMQAENGIPRFNPDNFSNPTKITNPFLPLKPGTQFTYVGFTVNDAGDHIPHEVVTTVTDLTKEICDGLDALVVHEEDLSDGELEEAEFFLVGQDNDGNVWRFGEYTESYDPESGEFLGGKAFFECHLEGAEAGIAMLADPSLDSPQYSQGFAPAPISFTDKGEVVALDREIDVPFGDFTGVLEIRETNEEEPDFFQSKFYSKRVGLIRVGGEDVQQETLALESIEKLGDEAMAAVREEVFALEARGNVVGSTEPAERMDK
jgi:hypothetical protein